ncbi:MAG: hypothetical protein NDF54_11920 [archaeon GB-1867-035]|nr:hypothetical protein [Candidatus Culexmicrobium profundum]
MSKILKQVEKISEKYEIFSNAFRILILAILYTRGPTKWKDLKQKLQEILNAEVNPNSLNFHLRRLEKEKLVKKIMEGNTAYYTKNDEIEESYKQIIEEIIDEIKIQSSQGENNGL